MRFENDMKFDYKDVLIRPKRSELTSRKEVCLNRSFKFPNYKSSIEEKVDYFGIPIMASNMDGVGTFEMADTLADQGMFTCLVKTYSEQELHDFFTNDEWKISHNRKSHVAYSMGISKEDYEKFKRVYESTKGNIKYVCIDVANGYTERFAQYIQTLRSNYPSIVIIAGNVVTADQTQELILNGADIVKVGIGPGSVCTTRIKTGVGYPQLSAVIECADAAHGLGGHIIADGGCTCPGDVAKAFAAGSDFVMLGGMLAGHDEGGGQVITKFYETNQIEYEVGSHLENRNRVIEEKHFVKFYGMSSKAANDKHFGGLKEYRSSEGREVLIPYRGSVKNTTQDLLGGLRSTCTYVGASTLKNLSKCTTFIKCTQQFNSIYV